jgi:hypothetical protein
MMKQEKQIRIIKRLKAQGTGAAPSEKQKAIVGESGQAINREVATIVTGWVREMRRKKTEEASREFERLFGRAA